MIVYNFFQQKLSQIKQSKTYILYILIKYIDFAALALSYLIIANKIGPTEYGKATYGFLFVSYSSLLLIGLFPMITKHFSIEVEQNHKYLFYYQWIFILGVLITCNIFSYLLLPVSYAALIGLISSLKIVQEATVTLNRVYNRFTSINFTTLFFSLPFLLCNIYVVNNVNDFFKYWAISLFLSSFLGLTSLKNEFFNKLNIVDFLQYVKTKFRILLSDSLSFSFLHIVNFIMTTSDRLIISKFIPAWSLGKYQFSENISNAMALGVNSIYFIVTPFIYNKLYKKEWAAVQFLNMSIKVAILIFIFYIIVFFPIIYGVEYFFPKYTEIKLITFLLLIAKLLASMSSIPLTIYIVASKEKSYATYLLIAAIFNVLLYFISTFSVTNLNILPILFPSIMILINFIFLIYLFLSIFRSKIRIV